MQVILRWFNMRPLRLLGGFLVFLSVGLLVFLVLLDIIAGLNNPYLGIITYMILPGVLVFGLLLVPLDAWIQRRRAARGEVTEYPVIDLCNPFQRRIAAFFVATSVVILVVMTVVTYKAVEFMDTTTFCGKVCHRVMIPEFTAYSRSPHASVACVECHIGPGAPWFARSKLSGLRQVWHYNVGDYERPVASPVKALRPSRETCENCHWPQEFYGGTLRTKFTYREDRQNTRVASTMVMRVGSGGVLGSGIHSHMISEILYLPAVENYSEIAWVRIKRPDGSEQEFVNMGRQEEIPAIRKEEEERFMDCIDCHNRAAHEFQEFEALLDDALTRREVDPGLPFIKREAMTAAGDLSGLPTNAEQAAAVKRIRRIPSFYKREFPDIYKSRRADINRSVNGTVTLYLDTAFPHMRVTPSTYPNWKSHEGCFRCHGVLVAADDKGRDKDISADCDLCHSMPSSKDPSELFQRP